MRFGCQAYPTRSSMSGPRPNQASPSEQTQSETRGSDSGDNRLRVLFVGGFRQTAPDGSTGGVAHACRTLVNSAIAEHVCWHLLDSTAESVPPPPWRRRFALAAKRLRSFRQTLASTPTDVVLLFSSAGASLLEKGLMAWMAHSTGVGVVFAPRSGLILASMERHSFWRWWMRFVLQCADRVVCQSESWCDFYMRLSGLPADRFAVTKNWIDTRPYRELSEAPQPPPVRVLYLGSLERYKGVYDLVEAVNSRRNDLDGVRFAMCGRGGEFERVRQLVQRLGLAERFELPGWVSGQAKMQQLQRVHIFVLPSHYEGFPNALLEAMAAGKAVVATAVGGVPELICNPTLGRLVPPKNPRALGEAVVELSRNADLRRELGRNARQHVLAHHDIENVWTKVLDVLKSASNRQNPRHG